MHIKTEKHSEQEVLEKLGVEKVKLGELLEQLKREREQLRLGKERERMERKREDFGHFNGQVSM